MSPTRTAPRRLLRAVAARAGAALITASGRLTRTEFIHPEHEDNALKNHESVIYALWHGRLWLLAARLRDRRAAILVSLSEDGELIARVTGRLGYRPVRGSTSRRGREALVALEAELRGGRSVALTPDGPRGPRHTAQVGAVVLAARTGKPILPVAAAARRAWEFPSWDAFQVPCPGTRGVIVFGEPILVPPGGDAEGWRSRLETALNAVESEADRAVGRDR
jgi:hypothetical protein